MPQPKSRKSTAAAAKPSTADTGTSAPQRAQTRTERRSETFEKRREERRKAPARKKRERLITRIVAAAVGVALAAGLAYGIFSYALDADERVRPAGVSTYAYSGGDHTADAVTYAESPPVGGTHDPVWQTCDFYDGPIRNENAVHSLEHGAVWITYRPDISGEEKDLLEDFDGRYVLISEYADQESPIVASAWNNQLEIASADSKELKQFVNYFRQGPQTQEPGATCDGGSTAVLG